LKVYVKSYSGDFIFRLIAREKIARRFSNRPQTFYPVILEGFEWKSLALYPRKSYGSAMLIDIDGSDFYLKYYTDSSHMLGVQ
jgi:hypothetical protein